MRQSNSPMWVFICIPLWIAFWKSFSHCRKIVYSRLCRYILWRRMCIRRDKIPFGNQSKHLNHENIRTNPIKCYFLILRKNYNIFRKMNLQEHFAHTNSQRVNNFVSYFDRLDTQKGCIQDFCYYTHLINELQKWDISFCNTVNLNRNVMATRRRLCNSYRHRVVHWDYSYSQSFCENKIDQ